MIKEAEAISQTALTRKEQQSWGDNLFAWIRDVKKTPVVKGCEDIQYNPRKFLVASLFCYQGEILGALDRRFRRLAQWSGKEACVREQDLDEHINVCFDRLIRCLPSIKNPDALPASALRIFRYVGFETQRREMKLHDKETSISSMQSDKEDSEVAEFLSILGGAKPHGTGRTLRANAEGLESDLIEQEEQEEQKRVLRRAYEIIARLKPIEQTIVRLHMEGYQNKEIAAQLGIPPNTLTQRLGRIMKNIARYARSDDGQSGE